MQVIKTGKGSLIVSRQPTREIDYHMFYPCPFCLGFYAKTELWRHAKERCEFRPKNAADKMQFQEVLREGRTLLLQETDERLADLLAPMHKDAIYDAISSEPLIQLFGMYLLDNYEGAYKQYCRERLRQLGRFLLFVCDKAEAEDLGYKELLQPENFDMVVANVKAFIVHESGARNSLALKLGHSIKRLALLLKGQCLRSPDSEEAGEIRKRTDIFLELFESEWSDRVSSQCLRRMADEKMNKAQELPLTSDLIITGWPKFL